MINMVGLLQFNVHAVSYSVAVYPNSLAVGDTVTVSFINTGSLENEYRVGYSLGQTGSITYLNNGDWSSESLYTFVPSSVGRYWVWCYVKDSNGSTNTSRVVDVLENSEPESSEPESSEPESSDESSDESSFDPMNWLPSDWEGGGFVQPSADSTPDLSYDELPSNLNEFWVSPKLSDIIVRAFKSFPAKLIVMMIPTIICLFVAWWLHK